MSAWCDDCDEPMVSNGLNESFECPTCKCYISWDAYYEFKASLRGWI
jgi:tRNA(Ile2) C34 agmatinyltransferase TiaS